MQDTAYRAIAIVGAGALLPDAPNVAAFWENVTTGRYSISEVPPDRWDQALYYSPDPSEPDKTYSKIGGWVREHPWDPLKWRLPIPPRVAAAMDEGQKWAITCTRQALMDYGYPERPLDADRTAVILGNAMAGEKHYLTSLRIYFPEYARELDQSASFAALPPALRRDITRELHNRIAQLLPEITEDTMPGELANCIAGRISNVFNFHGPNFTADAACASAMAAISAAAEGLVQKDFDVAITGGIDRNMGAPIFVKFCKIGALSATGSRPYAEGADGFVMGEGATIFVLKRLADAERDGDKIYAVLRGVGGASDGKGKGITAPNPVGQKMCLERAWQNAGLPPSTATLIEGHGTSTKVGDVVEVQSMTEVLSNSDLAIGSVALGSVKSNIGHLKGGAGGAGLLKAALALREKILPPSVHFERPNPDIDFAHSPLYVNTELRPWTVKTDTPRRSGVSAFGFGGTNFHLVLEEHIPHRLTGNGKRSIAVGEFPAIGSQGALPSPCKAPLRGALVIGGASEQVLTERLRSVLESAQAGRAPAIAAPMEADLRAPERLAIDYANASDLADKAGKALKGLASKQPAVWKALRAQGIFRGHGPSRKVAFLYTGQGSQYPNMLQALRATEPIVAETFAEADRRMVPLLGKPLSDFIFVNGADAAAVAKAEEDLRQTAITQPAVLATDISLTRMLAAYGIKPDMAMGHSLGEYGALVAAGALPFDDALEAVSARGREMTRWSMEDNGRMAAVFAPLDVIESILKTIDGYLVVANINSNTQAVIGGESSAVERAIGEFVKAGYNAIPLPVSHAFHTSIVAQASEPLRRMMERLRLEPPHLPVVANVTGEFYPTGPDALTQVLDLLGQQVASPVQFVKGLRTLYQAGARIFVEVGPKKALQGFADDVLGGDNDVFSLFTNHPKFDDAVAFNQALCGLYAAGLGRGEAEVGRAQVSATVETPKLVARTPAMPQPAMPTSAPAVPANGDRYTALGHLFADVLEQGLQIYQGHGEVRASQPVVITGAALGLPGTEHIFDDGNIARILRGDQFIDVIPTRFRRAMLDKHVTRLVKSENGEPTFESINELSDGIKLAGRGGAFDLESEFGVPAERMAALDRGTCLAIGAGIDALRDAGIPLVMRYKTTSKGTQLPDRWGLPDALRDETGVIFASAYPAYNGFAHELERYYADRILREQIALLESLRTRSVDGRNGSALEQEIERRIVDLRLAVEKDPYLLDRRFLFRTLSMGHSQFAELVGARGPNTQVNSACASTTQAVSLAQDWIHAGRCRRVIVISADDVTSDNLMEWFGAGFLASGAAATDEDVENAAIPFDRRRHGMILGMGAAAMVVESAEAVAERGLQPICEVLSAVTANSAFHGTRLDVQHISQVMENLIAQGEARNGIRRAAIAAHTVFVSHETYTPARGGSAAAEIHALRRVFGPDADKIVIANTKGLTGHAMGAGIEDVVGVKALETGCIPPVANFKEVDPELGVLNLSKGGAYPVEYALRLGAGFGSQISMTLLRRVPARDGVRRSPNALGYAYRIADSVAWDAWVSRICGHSGADLEVTHRTLRVRDQGLTARIAEVEQQLKPVPEPPPPVPQTKPEPAKPLPPEPAKAREEGDPVKERILALVAEKTGYPADMLDLDLDLEADLGVDTVKQAEVFASVREAYGIARDDKLKLREFPTLAHVIGFVHQHRPDLAAAAPHPAVPVAETHADTTTPQPLADPVKERILALVVEKTGYPKDMLDLDLDLEADLGVDTVKQAEMIAAIREMYGIPRDDSRKLRDYPTLAHVIRFVHDKRPDLAPGPVEPRPVVNEPVSAPAPVETAADAAIRDKVLTIVAEKTGYPKDMLDLDLDLEADLGIDTVKQAEMFASVRAAFDIPRDQNMKLRDFPTLVHVIRFAEERRQTPHADKDAGVPSSVSAEPVPSLPILADMSAANLIPRRVPIPVLRPPLSICKLTGVVLGPGSRVVIMPDQGGVSDALAERLQTMGVEVLLVENRSDGDAVVGQVRNWMTAGSVHGIYWLPALDVEAALGDMDHATWHEALRLRVKSLYNVMREVYPRGSAEETFLVSATRLGGQHGYDEAGAVAALGGAVTGFTKAYKRERMDALVKAIDFGLQHEPSEVARILVEEALRDPGAVEIGYKEDQRWTVSICERPAFDGQPGLPLDKNTVFLVTGAAGSIVSAITADLAAASGGTFYLLDLAPEPDANDPDLKRLTSDKEGLKRDLFARIQQRGERATPALVEKELAILEREQAALKAIDAVRSAGGTARYYKVDLLDAAAVAAIVQDVRERSGRIDVLLHAAGIERSHFLPDKEQREFDLVFDVKADGWFNLLHAIGDMPLGATVAFSSIAGRFGNGGQTDYSSANDLLCKLASNLRSTRPATRAIAIDWTAWGGIGMASRGSIPKMMELAGIDMLTPEAGIPVIRRELTTGGTRGEVVIAHRLGLLLSEWDATGGLDTTAVEDSGERLLTQGPMIGKIAGMSLHRGLLIETTLDPEVQPFLNDHRIDGTPVLPGVMGIEAFAEASLWLLPGWTISAIEDVNFLAPFKFYRNEPRRLTIEVSFSPMGEDLLAECRLIGSRELPGQPEPQLTTHFTARVRLTKSNVPEAVMAPAPGAPAASTMDARDLYRIYFHGPAYQVIERAWSDHQGVIGQFAEGLPSNHYPPEKPLFAAPRLIELCFQTAGVWEIGVLGHMGLPQHVKRVTLCRVPDSAETRFYAVVTPDPREETFDAVVIDAQGRQYLQLTGYRTVALPNAIDAEPLEALHAVMA